RAERSIRDIVGYYRSPRIEPASATEPARVKATLKVLESAGWLWSMIAESVADQRPFIGLSVDFVGSVKPASRNGVAVKEVQAMRQLLSIDVVTRPSAGGRFERILNSEQSSLPNEEAPETEEQEEPMTVTEQPESSTDGLTPVQEAQRLVEEAK